MKSGFSEAEIFQQIRQSMLIALAHHKWGDLEKNASVLRGLLNEIEENADVNSDKLDEIIANLELFFSAIEIYKNPPKPEEQASEKDKKKFRDKLASIDSFFQYFLRDHIASLEKSLRMLKKREYMQARFLFSFYYQQLRNTLNKVKTDKFNIQEDVYKHIDLIYMQKNTSEAKKLVLMEQ